VIPEGGILNRLYTILFLTNNILIMKSTRFIVSAIIAITSSVFTFAQTHDHSQMTSVKTENFKVWGNCDMCKARIEKAAKIEGVSKVDWNKDTKILTLAYNPSVVTLDDIQKKIASVGHDTETYKADIKTYNSLPGCCKYERRN
jgi:copper chaperone CopZ